MKSMVNQATTFTYEIDLQPGEPLALPSDVMANLQAGHWRITFQPVLTAVSSESPSRDHGAFLSSYAPEDEGLYDDYSR
jgi:hypothetical protein